jgi:cytochrome c-type biogenesis protein CcmH/NrfF
VGEIRVVNLSQWESVKRCVERIPAKDSFAASWTAFAAGVAASGLVGLITVRYTIATKANPHSSAQSFLFWMTVFAIVVTVLMYVTERRASHHQESHIQALKD